jgi:membrane protein implicated in regulation of membrane protease activity
MGLLLTLGEIFTPGAFFLCFFGISALIIGVLTGIGIPLPLWAQWGLFSVLSVLSLLLLRARLVSTKKDHTAQVDRDSLVGAEGRSIETIPPQGFGSVEVRGSNWKSQNCGSQLIAANDRIKVIRTENITLFIEKM